MSLTKVTYSMIQGAPLNVLDHGADATGVADSSAAIQAAVNAGSLVYIPSGAYKLNTVITVPVATTVYGAGRDTVIKAYGVDAFQILGGSDGVTICSMTMLSYSGAGVADPRLYAAILCDGTTGSHVNGFLARDLYLQGWIDAIAWRYTWTSRMENVSTVNCNYGLYLFGQSVNNAISNCSLVVNSGIASVGFDADVTVIGEGLVIINSLLASGTYGIYGDGHLGLCVTNCIVDLVTDSAIAIVNPIAMCLTNSWIYAANFGVYLAPLGIASEQGNTISNCHITTTAAASYGIKVDHNNNGNTMIGGSITIPATGTNCVRNLSDSTTVVGVNLVNPSANSSVYYEYGFACNFVGCSGNTAFEYVNGTPPKMGLPLAPFNYSVPYSASMTPDCAYGSQFTIPIANGTAFTIQNPTNAPYLKEGAEITFAIFNLSGGAAGVLTWGSYFKTAGAWVQPANNTFRTISFKWLGGNRWAETSRTTVDLAL